MGQMKNSVMIVLMVISILFSGLRTIHSQIMNGNPAPGHLFTYQVSITFLGDHICGGAIIDESHILTAGHCIYDLAAECLLVIAGKIRLDEAGLVGKSVRRIRLHPDFTIHTPPPVVVDEIGNYSLSSFENDIAVLTLSESLAFNQDIGRISLPTVNLVPCSYGILCGWGQNVKNGTMSKHLMWSSLMVMDRASCIILGLGHRTNSEFCAVDPRGLSTTGRGDSGGPLVHNLMVVGIHLGSYFEPSYPVLFTNVYFHREFIVQAMND